MRDLVLLYVRTYQRRLEPVVILRNRHMTIVHRAISGAISAPEINSRPPSVPNRATCGSKTELARCTETKNQPELGHPLSKRSLGNAPFLRALFFLAEKGTVWVRVSN